MILFLATKGYLPRLDLESPLLINKGLGSLVKKEMKLVNVTAEKIEVLRMYLRDDMLDSRFITTIRPNKSLDFKILGPYKIVCVINNIAYELDLPDSIGKIFPIFHF